MVTRSGSAGTRWRGLALRDLLGRADWKCGTESVLRRGCASRCGTETVLQPRRAASRRGRSRSLEARDRDGPAAPFCGTVPSRLTGSLPPFHLCNTGSLLSIYVTIFHIPKSSAKIIFRVHRLPPFYSCNDSQIKCNDGAGRHGAAEWGCGIASVTRPLLVPTLGSGRCPALWLSDPVRPGQSLPHSARPTSFSFSLRDESVQRQSRTTLLSYARVTISFPLIQRAGKVYFCKIIENKNIFSNLILTFGKKLSQTSLDIY